MEELKPSQSVVEPGTVAEKPLVKEFPKKKFLKSNLMIAVIALLVVLGGVAAGWFLSGRNLAGKSDQPVTSSQATNTPNEAGIADATTFKDTAEGTLQSGGIKGEGTHHLDRNLGEDKFVYLNSTVIDLDAFVGKKVQVWGETNKGKYAGWLMDVGKIKIIN